ncbi:MAG: type II toxin-antitoxin system prevent-host-death family antitoxin [Chloroflexota bacterium]|nr:type II toxin-antitoxin system prevent-host-death family antitoxin [Chloroflexota bacterium]
MPLDTHTTPHYNVRTSYESYYRCTIEIGETMTALTHEIQASEARTRLPDLITQAVRAGVPSIISRQGKERAVLASADIWGRMTAPYAVHVQYLPDEETGAWALWIPELRLHAEGATIAEARAELVSVVHDYLEQYFSNWPQYQYIEDRAAELLYILRLWLAHDDADLAHLLFNSPIA